MQRFVERAVTLYLSIKHQKPKTFSTDIAIHTIYFWFGVLGVLCQTILHLDGLCVITLLTACGDALRRHKFSISYLSRFTASFPLFLSRDQHVYFIILIEFGILRFEQKENTKPVWFTVFDYFYVIIRQTKNPVVFQTLLTSTPEIPCTRGIIYRTDLWRYSDHKIAIGVNIKTNLKTRSRHFIKHSKPYRWGGALLKCTIVYSDIVVHYTY